MRQILLIICTATALSLSACAAESNGGSPTSAGAPASGASARAGSPSSTSPPACAPASLRTHTANKLTVATDSPAYPPWFVDNKPANGKGFESAVAFAVAKQLGYDAQEVSWTHASFNSVIAPTPKNYDVDINQVSITPARAKAVDFSSGYYDVAQSVITLKKSKIAGAKTLAGLRGSKLGAQQGTTSLDAITDIIKPGRKPSEYPTNDLAVQALKNGQIDGLVVDLPTGLYLTSAELDNAVIVGQLPITGKAEQFGLVLTKGSPLTACVSKAVDALRAAGTLHTLQQRWLTTSAGAPELK
jgi:polar amino acid transport system substrate-binding protein